VKALNKVGSSAEAVSTSVSARAPTSKQRGGDTRTTSAPPRTTPARTTTAPRPTTPTCVNHRRIIGYREGRPIYQTC
jgi:hypothetical protein